MAREAPSRVGSHHDVVVIGAGYSGVAATLYLQKQGLNVVCLEARDRIGGRVYTTNADDPAKWVDLVAAGGAYVGPTQDALMSWAEETGVETYKVHTHGKNIFHAHGKKLVHEGTIPSLDIFSLLDVNKLLVTNDKLAETVPLKNPETTPDAKLLDSMTVAEWLRGHAETRMGAVGLEAAVTSLLTSNISEISMLSWLWYVRSGQSVMRLVEAENAAQERKFVGGTGAVLARKASQLREGTIRLNSAVRSVKNWQQHESSAENNNVEVETRDGRVFTAKYVIMAMAPTLYGRLEYSPPLPSSRQQLVQRMPMGCIIKTVVYYERAWWRDAGYSGSIFSHTPSQPTTTTSSTTAGSGSGPVWYSYDDCKPDGSKPALMGFVLADAAKEYADASREERLAAITRQYAELFGIDDALHPIGYEELNWSAEEFSAGCYVGVMPPQFITNYFHTMRSNMGKVHFAGTETAFEWSGYIDGAIRAGDSAAHAVCQLLQPEMAPTKPEYPPSKTLIPKPIGPSALEKMLPGANFVKIVGGAVLAGIVAVVAWAISKHA